MRTNLRRILRKSRPGYAVVSNLLRALNTSLCILDNDENLLMGASGSQEQAKTAVMQDDFLSGWVCGQEEQAHVIAQLLESMLIQEKEKSALSDELIDSYRELNILYNLSEHLLAAPDPKAIGSTTLQEIEQLIQISSAWVLIKKDETGELASIAAVGAPVELRRNIGKNDFVGALIARNDAEILNDVSGDLIFNNPPSDLVAALCAPLRTEQRVLGCLLLVVEPPHGFTARDLKLLNTIALQAGPAIEMARLYQIAVHQGRIERELQMAYEVQASLIPAEIPSVETGWEFAGRWHPARELSGDYYDIIPHGPQTYGLVIADVADKGMPSALFMVNTRSAVRAAVDQTNSPAAAITKANRLVASEAADSLFVSMIYGQLDSRTGSLIYVNAGHNPALHFRAANRQFDDLGFTGIPIGILDDTSYTQRSVELEPGDLLVLYTDGVTEAIDQSNNEFGMDRLRSIIVGNPTAPADSLATMIEAAVDQFTASAPLFDDFTLLIVRRL